MALCLHCRAKEQSPKSPYHKQSLYCGRPCSQAARRRAVSLAPQPAMHCKICASQLAQRPPGKCGRAILYCGPACERIAVLRQRKERYRRDRTEGPRRTGLVSAVQPGVRFGKLVVLEAKAKHARVECDCGTVKQVFKHNLLAGDVISCGCIRRAVLLEARAKRLLKGELFVAKSRVGYVQPGRPRKIEGRPGVYAAEPSAEMDDTPVCYVVSTRDKETEHCTFDEARVEYLLRTGRMSA